MVLFWFELDVVWCFYLYYEVLWVQGVVVWVDELHAYVVFGYDDVTRIL